jgi:hypothetical protein
MLIAERLPASRYKTISNLEKSITAVRRRPKPLFDRPQERRTPQLRSPVFHDYRLKGFEEACGRFVAGVFNAANRTLDSSGHKIPPVHRTPQKPKPHEYERNHKNTKLQAGDRAALHAE